MMLKQYKPWHLNLLNIQEIIQTIKNDTSLQHNGIKQGSLTWYYTISAADRDQKKKWYLNRRYHIF